MNLLAAISAAAIRPDDWNLPLFLHILGAMALVGAVVTAVYFLFLARGDGSLQTTRSGFRWLVFGALPSYIVMRIAAQWIASKQGLEDSDAAWIGIGFITSDLGALAIIGSTIATGLALRRAGRGEGGADAAGRTATVVAWLMSGLVVLYVVAVWAMTAKPA